MKEEGIIKMGSEGPKGRYEFFPNSGGRGWEITSGTCLELWDYKAEEWVETRIEFDHGEGRYYAVVRDDLFFHDASARN